MQLLDPLHKGRLITQLGSREQLQLFQLRAVVGFGKHHVNTYQCDMVIVKQPVNQVRNFVATPGPAPYLGQAFFVDVNDHDTVIQRPGHGGAQPSIVDDVIQVINNANVQQAGGMHQGQQQWNQRDRDVWLTFGKRIHHTVTAAG